MRHDCTYNKEVYKNDCVFTCYGQTINIIAAKQLTKNAASAHCTLHTAQYNN